MYPESTEQISLQEKKAIVQGIIDNHLPDGKQFSIAEWDEEQVDLLIDLLAAEDDLERAIIFDQIEAIIEDAHISLLLTANEIFKITDMLEHMKLESNELNSLKNLIQTEKEMDKNLEDIF